MDNATRIASTIEAHVTGGPPLERAGAEKARTLVPLLVLVVALIVGEVFFYCVLKQPASFGLRGDVGAEVEVALFRCRKEPGRRVLFVGDSRTTWGIDPRAVEAACADKGVAVVAANIAVEGEAVTRSLRRVLDRGLRPDVVVVGGSTWNLAPFAKAAPPEAEPPYVSPDELLNYVITFPIRNSIRILRGRSVGRALIGWVGKRFATPDLPARWYHCTLGGYNALRVNPEHTGRFKAEIEHFRKVLTTIDSDQIEAHAAAVAALINALDARGVTVVLVRVPTGATLRGIEDAAFDYNAFVARIEAESPLIVWPGDQLQAAFEGRAADWSHLPESTAQDFSRRLGELLVERGIVKP